MGTGEGIGTGEGMGTGAGIGTGAGEGSRGEGRGRGSCGASSSRETPRASMESVYLAVVAWSSSTSSACAESSGWSASVSTCGKHTRKEATKGGHTDQRELQGESAGLTGGCWGGGGALRSVREGGRAARRSGRGRVRRTAL
eukprot:6815236-Prymnesium_polylepis.1